MAALFRRIKGLKYNGSNSQDLVNLINTCGATNWTVTHADSQSMMMGGVHGGEWSETLIELNQWIIFETDIERSFILTDVQVQAWFIPQEEVTPVRHAGMGLAAAPAFTGNGNTTVQVTIKPTQPDMNYHAESFLSGSITLLGNLSILSTTKVSESRVDVVVRNTGITSVSGVAVLVDVT